MSQPIAIDFTAAAETAFSPVNVLWKAMLTGVLRPVWVAAIAYSVMHWIMTHKMPSALTKTLLTALHILLLMAVVADYMANNPS